MDCVVIATCIFQMNRFLLLSPDAPIVDVQYGDEIVTCTSDGNPAANTHVIIVNGTDQFTPTCSDGTCTLPLKVDYDTDVRCHATNEVGTGSDTAVAVPGMLKLCHMLNVDVAQAFSNNSSFGVKFAFYNKTLTFLVICYSVICWYTGASPPPPTTTRLTRGLTTSLTGMWSNKSKYHCINFLS